MPCKIALSLVAFPVWMLADNEQSPGWLAIHQSNHSRCFQPLAPRAHGWLA